MRCPDYDHCLPGIPSSILRHYNAQPEHSTLPMLDACLTSAYKNVVVILLDGFGSAILEHHKSHAPFLAAHKLDDLSTVFPPTTTAATTTMVSGLTPAQHSWLGWSLYFKELDQNVDLFPNIISDTHDIPAADYNVARRYLPYRSVNARIESATDGAVRAEDIYPFSGYRTQSPADMCDVIERLCAGPERRYLYAYWHDPDSLMHRNGVGHPLVVDCVRTLDRQIEALRRRLTDTLLIVTADHGMIDTRYEFLVDRPELTQTFLRPPSIEQRALNFFLKPGQEAAFTHLFTDLYGDSFALFSRDEVIRHKLFGGGTPHPRFEAFLGQYLAVAHSSLSLAYCRPKTHEIFKAMHAGMHEDEMIVPLIVID